MSLIPNITSVTALADHTLDLTFTDGTKGRIHLSSMLKGPLFDALANPAEFSRVKLDGYGSICWPNGADLDPVLAHEAANHCNGDLDRARTSLDQRYKERAGT